MDNYVRMEDFKGLEEDMVTKSDYAVLQESLKYLQKDYN